MEFEEKKIKQTKDLNRHDCDLQLHKSNTQGRHANRISIMIF